MAGILVALALSGCEPPTPRETCDKLETLSDEAKREGYEFDEDKCLGKMKELKKRDADAYKCAAKLVKKLDSYDAALLAVSVCDPKKDDDDDDDDKVKKEKKGTASATPSGTPAGGSPDPARFTSAAGRFSAAFPEAPKEKSEERQNVTWYETRLESGGRYDVTYADFPDAQAAAAARDAYNDNLNKSPNATEGKELTIDGHRARVTTINISDKTTMWMRTIVVGKRFYKINAASSNPAKALQFLDSVKVTI